jgi:hypothetical protein
MISDMTTATPNVNPPPPPIIEFKTTDPTIQKGKSTNLTWRAQNAAEVAIDPGLGKVSASGEQTVSPTETTTYTLTASGLGGKKEERLTIIVTQPPQLVLNNITQIHNGTTFRSAITWRFEVYVNGTIVAKIPQHSFDPNVRVAPVNTNGGVIWAPVVVPNGTNLNVKVIGYKESSTTADATGEAAWQPTTSTDNLSVHVVHDPPMFGDFYFTFSLRNPPASK